MKYTKTDLKEGRVAITTENNGQDVYNLLKEVFPDDNDTYWYKNDIDTFNHKFCYHADKRQPTNWNWSNKEDNKLPVVFPSQIECVASKNESMRVFESGATRNLDIDKLDFEGFLSPLALEEFAKYMHKNRVQADGNRRDSDNWQKGFGSKVLMSSMWRHFFDTWKRHRGLETPENQTENLCGLLFNVQAMLHEHLKTEQNDKI